MSENTSAAGGDFSWVEWLPSPSMVVGKDGVIYAANLEMAKLVGRNAGDELVGLSNSEVTVDGDRDGDRSDFDAVFAKGPGIYHKTKRYLHATGSSVLSQVKGRVVEDVIVIEVVRSEGVEGGTSNLVPGYDLFHRIMDRAPFLIYSRDLEGRYVVVNKRYEEVFGVKRREIEGKTPYDVLPKEAAEMVLAHDKEVAECGKSLQFEEEINFKGNEICSLAWNFPIYDKDGELAGVGGMSTDISQRMRAERELRKANRGMESAYKELRMTQLQLIQAEKMESIGRLAAGVAHEVKNPLAMLLMGIDYIDGIPADADPNLKEIVGEMRTAVKRAEGIVHGLVDFSAQRQLEFSKVDMNFIVESCLPFLRHELTRDRISLEVFQDDDMPKMRVDVQKFEQVVINLMINAIQAMSDAGGKLVIRTGSKVVEGLPGDDGRRTRDHIRNGDTVATLLIEDTGPGISQENLARIFDPFFTTKATGEGTGLGLSICKKIIDLHHGWIGVESEVGVGTKIEIYIKTVDSERMNKDGGVEGE